MGLSKTIFGEGSHGMFSPPLSQNNSSVHHPPLNRLNSQGASSEKKGEANLDCESQGGKEVALREGQGELETWERDREAKQVHR